MFDHDVKKNNKLFCDSQIQYKFTHICVLDKLFQQIIIKLEGLGQLTH